MVSKAIQEAKIGIGIGGKLVVEVNGYTITINAKKTEGSLYLDVIVPDGKAVYNSGQTEERVWISAGKKAEA